MSKYLPLIHRSEHSLDNSDLSENESERSDVEAGTESENVDLEKGIFFEPYIPVAEEEQPDSGITPARRKWVCCTWFLTWWIPVRHYLFQ